MQFPAPDLQNQAAKMAEETMSNKSAMTHPPDYPEYSMSYEQLRVLPVKSPANSLTTSRKKRRRQKKGKGRTEPLATPIVPISTGLIISEIFII